MPQLDIITISVQTVFIFYSIFSLLLVTQGLLFPDYLTLNISKKIFWNFLNTLITQIKYYTYLKYSHLISAVSFFIRISVESLYTLKFLTENFSISFLNIFKQNTLIYLNLFLYKNMSFSAFSDSEKLSLISFGQKKASNFFLKKIKVGFSLFSFKIKKNYIEILNIFLSKRRRRKIEVKAGIKYWTLEDKIFIKRTSRNTFFGNKYIFKLDF